MEATLCFVHCGSPKGSRENILKNGRGHRFSPEYILRVLAKDEVGLLIINRKRGSVARKKALPLF